MTEYTIRFIGRNAYLSDEKHNSESIVSMDFKSVMTGVSNRQGMDLDSSQPVVIITPERVVKILPKDSLNIQTSNK